MSTVYTGVDNGLDGGVITLRGNTVVGKHRFVKTKLRWGNQIAAAPLLEYFESILAQFPSERHFVLVEEPVKQMGANTNAQAIQSTGASFGKVVAVIELLQNRVSYDTIIPRSWQGTFFKPGGEDTKTKSISAATRLFPTADFRVSSLGKGPHDGFTDACLIAEHARRSGL
jgi:hypothetical protein